MLATYPHLLSTDSLAFAQRLEEEIGLSWGRIAVFILLPRSDEPDRRQRLLHSFS